MARVQSSAHVVLVGEAQVRAHPQLDHWDPPPEPAALMAEAGRRALTDGGIPFGAVDTIGFVEPLAWPYDDLGGVLRAALGLPDATTFTVPPGGNSGVDVLHDAVERVRAGAARVVLLVGGDAVGAAARSFKNGEPLDWTPFEQQPDALRGQRDLSNALEARHGLVFPADSYPLFESALRAEMGRSVADHHVALAALLGRNAAVARSNPFAWFRDPPTADDIAAVSPSNRWVSTPYTKLMNAFMQVDLGAAVVCCTATTAAELGVPVDRHVSYLAGAAAVDAWCITERPSLTSSPALRAAGCAALADAGTHVDAIDAFDLYSCFPCAIEIAAAELGVPLDGPVPLTVTGGLAYAGGPGNSYSLHAIAAMAHRLRAHDGGATGLVSAVGMVMAKHSVAVLSTVPSAVTAASGAFRRVTLDAADCAGPPLDEQPDGTGRIEACTVAFDRGGDAVRATAIIRLDGGARTVANLRTLDGARTLAEDEPVGMRVRVRPGGTGPNWFEVVG